MLLPYRGQDNVFKEFKLDEPWDSAHNKKLIEKMPDVYKNGDPALEKQFKTRLLAAVGEKTVFPTKDEKITLGAITVKNGTSNTIAFAVEAATDKAVVWTKTRRCGNRSQEPGIRVSQPWIRPSSLLLPVMLPFIESRSTLMPKRWQARLLGKNYLKAIPSLLSDNRPDPPCQAASYVK